MSRFRGSGVRKRKEVKEIRYLIPDFLIENTINIIYAPPKQGKSMFLCGVSKWLYKHTDFYTEYYDFDNPIIALEARGVDDLWEEMDDRFDYIHPEELEKATRDKDEVIVDSKDVLEVLVKDTDIVAKNYKDTLFIFDSATDFCDETNDNSVKNFMGKMKRLRLAGATIIILHHTNKKDPNHKGSTVFKSACDCMYKLTLEYEDSEGKTYLLTKDDARFLVKDCAFRLENGYNLEMLNVEEVKIPHSEQVEIRKLTKVLQQHGELSQNDLLDKALDTNSTNKTATALLAKYNMKYWTFEKKGKSNMYKLI